MPVTDASRDGWGRAKKNAWRRQAVTRCSTTTQVPRNPVSAAIPHWPAN